MTTAILNVDNGDAKRYLTAGRATVTMSRTDNGNRMTFKVNKAKVGDTLFASFMNGSDNETSFAYVGILNPTSGEIYLTPKSRYGNDSQVVKVLRWMTSFLFQNKALPAVVELRHCGKCGRCGRKLTVPESIEAGVGPECRELMGLPSLPGRKTKRPKVEKPVIFTNKPEDRAGVTNIDPVLVNRAGTFNRNDIELATGA